MKLQNTSLLSPVVYEPGYLSKDEMWAAIPYGNRFMIIHNGCQGKVFNTLDNAKKYIEAQVKSVKKSASSSTLEKHLVV